MIITIALTIACVSFSCKQKSEEGIPDEYPYSFSLFTSTGEEICSVSSSGVVSRERITVQVEGKNVYSWCANVNGESVRVIDNEELIKKNGKYIVTSFGNEKIVVYPEKYYTTVTIGNVALKAVHGEVPSAINVPSKDFSKFLGYYYIKNNGEKVFVTNEDGKFLVPWSIEANTLELSPEFESLPIAIELDYIYDDVLGKNENNVPEYIYYGDKFSFDFPIPSIPDKYVFVGWYSTERSGVMITDGRGSYNIDTFKSDAGINLKYSINKTEEGEYPYVVTFYARWQAAPHKVTFFSEDKEVRQINVNYGDDVPFYEISVAPVGKVFDYWYEGDDDTKPFDFENAKVGVSDVVLKSKWKPSVHVVNYYDGEKIVDSRRYEYGEKIVKPAVVLSKDGFEFKGYSLKAVYYNQSNADIYDFDSVVTEDISLYAVWDKIVYTVSFVTNGGTPIADRTTSITEGYKLEKVTSERTYYVLKGWYMDETFSPEKVFRYESVVTDNMILYARWEPINVKVRFDDGSEYGLERITNVECSFLINDIPTPEKKGHSFDSWYYNGSPISENELCEMEFLPTSAPEYVVSSKWKKNKHKLIYKDGDVTVNEQEYEYGDAVTPFVYKKKGYTFVKWIGLPEIIPDEDKETFAECEMIEYTVYYKKDDVLIENYTQNNVHYGDIIEYPDIPIEQGKTFSDWRSQFDDKPEKMPDCSLTFAVTSSLNEHSVVYVLDGEEYVRETIKYGYLITDVSVDKEGYTFSGWKYGDVSIENVTLPDEDIVVSGTTTINDYCLTVKHRIKGIIEDSMTETQTITYGNALSLPLDIRGYTAYELNCDVCSNVVKMVVTDEGRSLKCTMGARDVEVIVDYIPNRYPITIEYVVGGNGFSKEKDKYYFDYDETFSVAVESVYGYSSNKNVISGIITDEEVTYTVVYSPINYSITVKYLCATDNASLAVPETKYQLYNTEQEYEPIEIKGYIPRETKVSVELSGSLSNEMRNVVFYYDAKQYAITYNLSASSILTSPSISSSARKTIAYNDNKRFGVPAADYYVFDGWFTAKNGGARLTNNKGEIVDAEGYVVNQRWIKDSDTTMYAHWKQQYDGTYIYDQNGLQSIKNNNVGTYYIIRDIWIDNWSMIDWFGGKLNGLGHSISNLFFTNNWDYCYEGWAMFDTLYKATVTDIVFKDVNIWLGNNKNEKNTRLGTLAKYVDSSYVANITVESGWGVRVEAYHGGLSQVGGIVGCARNTSFINCTNRVHVLAEKGSAAAGGIAGWSEGWCIFTNCYNFGQIDSKGIVYKGHAASGGICGCIENKNYDFNGCGNFGELNAYSGATGVSKKKGNDWAREK